MFIPLNFKNLINLLALLSIMLGGYLKTTPFSGADSILFIGTGCLLGSLYFLIKEMQLDAMPVAFIYPATMAILLNVLGLLFKRQHWPGGNSIIWLALIMSVVAILVFALSKTEFKIPKQFVVCIFLYLVLAMNLLGIWNLGI